MFRQFYTTSMSASKKQLQARFTKIRTRTGKGARMMSVFTACVLIVAAAAATIAMAASDGLQLKNGTIVIDNKKHPIDIRYVDNPQYLNADSYYLPLRKTFELLGCKVIYNAVPVKVSGELTAGFPSTTANGGEKIPAIMMRNNVNGTDNDGIITVVSPNGYEWHCRVGSERYKNVWAPPVIMVEGTAYIPIRAVAGYLIPNDEDGDRSILYDAFAHDSYYQGRLSFDSDTMTVTIDTDAGAGNAPQIDTYRRLINAYDVDQRMESRNYLVCGINDADTYSYIAIDKQTGRIARLITSPKQPGTYMNFTDENIIEFSRFIPNTDRLQPVAAYDLAAQTYIEFK